MGPATSCVSMEQKNLFRKSLTKSIRSLAFLQILLLFLCIAFKSLSYAKDQQTNNKAYKTFFFELAGNGVVYSINYDRIFYKKQNFAASARVGFEYLPPIRGFTVIIIPVELNGMLGRTKHHFEFGLGHTYNSNVYYLLQKRSSKNLQKSFSDCQAWI